MLYEELAMANPVRVEKFYKRFKLLLMNALEYNVGHGGVSASPPRVARARGTRARGTVHVRTDGSSYVHSNGNTV